MHLKILTTLFAIALLSACSSGEDTPAPENQDTPSPTTTPIPTELSKPNNAHLENGLPPVIEQF